MSPPRYSPERFPPSSPDWAGLLPWLGRAHRAIAQYEGVLAGVPNPQILLSPLAGQEAVVSSRIEGTRSSLREVLALDSTGSGDIGPDRAPPDVQEVLNYRLALLTAEGMLEKLPLSQRVIRRAHAVLMKGVRGDTAAPGEYRRIQNWIGAPNSTEATATFVPCPPQHIPEAMDAWERYLHSDTPDELFQLAVLHVWFEAIHPFLDGNGRLGRLMMPLFLVARGMLVRPNLYLSEYLERYRSEYYRRLLLAQSGGDWRPWMRYFLTGIEQQANANAEKARNIMELHEEGKTRVSRLLRSQYASAALDMLFRSPVFRSSDFRRHSGAPRPTAMRFLRVLRREGMLEELVAPRGNRPALLWFPELIEIAQRPSDFGPVPP